MENKRQGIVWGKTDREVLACLTNRILAEGWQTSPIATHPDFEFIQDAAREAQQIRKIKPGTDGK